MQDVIHFNCRALVASVPFFNNADPYFVSEVTLNFKLKAYNCNAKGATELVMTSRHHSST